MAKPASYRRSTNFAKHGRWGLLFLLWWWAILSAWIATKREAHGPLLERSLHLATAGILCLAVAALLYVGRRTLARDEKVRSLVLIERGLLRDNPWHGEKRPAASVLADTERQICATLQHISGALEEWSLASLLDFTRRSLGIPRLVSVWMPSLREQVFTCRFHYPLVPDVYEALVRDYRPRMHDEDGYVRFLDEWKDRLPKDETTYIEAKASVTSLMGVVFDTGLTAYVDDVDAYPSTDPIFERSYEKFLTEPCRSLFMRRLEVSEMPQGVLVIFDPIRHGLMFASETVLEGYAHHIELLLARYAHFERIA